MPFGASSFSAVRDLSEHCALPITVGFLIAAAFILAFGVKPAKAGIQNYDLSLVNASPASTDGWTNGEIWDHDNVALYKVTVVESGWYEFDFQGRSLGRGTFELWSADLARCYTSWGFENGSEEYPTTIKMKRALNPGVYYLKVIPWPYDATCVGEYRIRALFTLKSKDNGRSMKTNSFATARRLAAGIRAKGFLSMTDDSDYYRINLPSRTKVTVTYITAVKESAFSLWSGDQIQIWSDSAGGYEYWPGTAVYEDTLDAGTYYIKIKSWPYSSDTADNTGRYTLMWTSDYERQLACRKAIASFRAKSVIPALSARRTGTGIVTASWKRCYQADGYQFQYSTSSGMTNARTFRKVGSASKSIIVNNLQKNRYHYFRVRAFKYFDGKIYYAAWSPVKALYVK